MTQQERNILRNEIIDELLLDAKLIEDLVPELHLKDTDLIEINGGRCVTVKTLRGAGIDIELLYDTFLRKDKSDITLHAITARQGFSSGIFLPGRSGANVDGYGNMEVESITVRSYLKVFELIYNRLNALEGNTSFADSGTIESIEPYTGSAPGLSGTYTATMRKRWDGDFTAFQPGDIIYGYVNDLRDENGGTNLDYYKCWARVNSVDRSANTLNLTKYADDTAIIPGGKNFGLRPGMLVSRWGNDINPEFEENQTNPDYGSFIVNRNGKWVNTRQQSFYISCEDGNIVELTGVDSPILKASNYGTILGQLPHGMAESLGVTKYVNPGQPYLYARGIIVQDLIRINYKGEEMPTPVFRGEWNKETAESATDYYRKGGGEQHIVGSGGYLWQCNVEHASGFPPSLAGDHAGEWTRLTGGLEPLWQIVPSVNQIHIRGNGRSEETLEVKVICTSMGGQAVITTAEGLDPHGMELVYSLDGVQHSDYWVRDGEEVTGTGLQIGGNNIPWMEVRDNIYLTLREKESGQVHCINVVAVTKDGADGADGEGVKGDDGTSAEARYHKVAAGYELTPSDWNSAYRSNPAPPGWETSHNGVDYGGSLWMINGVKKSDGTLVGEWSEPVCLTQKPAEAVPGKTGPCVYPAGIFDPDIRYTSTDTRRPVVQEGEINGVPQFFALKCDKAFRGTDITDTKHNTPGVDVANGGEYWEWFDAFSLVYAQFLLADFAKLNSAVFWGNYMMSQFGYNPVTGAKYDTEDGAYRNFVNGGFRPNLLIDFLSGMVETNNIVFNGFCRQKKCVINNDTSPRYYDTALGGYRWEDCGSFIEFSLDANRQTRHLHMPSCVDNDDSPRYFVGDTGLVCNKSIATVKVHGLFMELLGYAAAKDLGGNKIGNTPYYSDVLGEIEIEPGTARSLKCVLAPLTASQSGYFVWEAGMPVNLY